MRFYIPMFLLSASAARAFRSATLQSSMRATGSTRTRSWSSNQFDFKLRATSSSATESTASAATAASENINAVGKGEEIHGRLSLGTENRNQGLDVKTIVQDMDVVKSHLRARSSNNQDQIQNVDQVVALSKDRTRLIQERDQFLNTRKKASATVGQLMRTKKEWENGDGDEEEQLNAAKEDSQKAAEGASKAEEELEGIQSKLDSLVAGMPNLLDDRVPAGADENDNELVYEWGDIHALPKSLGWDDSEDKKHLWHDDVATQLNGYQAEAAVQMSGSRFVALSGAVARLERAIAMFCVDLHSVDHAYTEVSVPLVVSRSSLEGTSQLPKFEEDLFAITRESHTCNGEDAFLIPTAEVPVTNLHRGQVLAESDLPIKYVAWTPCFRAEAGSYGRDTKGLIRTHQFGKVELVKVTTPESSDDEHEQLTRDAEAVLKALELPYRKVRLCSGDLGFGARHCYDLEVWLPGANEYREISSCSNTGDFQARRMGLRYRPNPTADEAGKGKKPKKAKPVLCHTINGSGLAVGRTLVAVLENYQKPDGSVVVPKVLRPYMGGIDVLSK